jgi:hypothetical protein
MVERETIAKLWKEVDPARSSPPIIQNCGPIISQADIDAAERLAAEKLSQADIDAAERLAAEKRSTPAPDLPTSLFEQASQQNQICPERTLLPWPPPLATAYVSYRSQDLNHAGLKTVGDVNMWLWNQLATAGFDQHKHWAVPGGFALVTPLDAIDDLARPLESYQSRGALEGRSWRDFGFSLVDFLYSMVSRPVNRARVFLFVLTTDERAGNPQVLMTNDYAKEWKNCGGTDLYALEGVKASDALAADHLFLIFVYEFVKPPRNDPEIVEAGTGRRVDYYLKGSKLKIAEQLR